MTRVSVMFSSALKNKLSQTTAAGVDLRGSSCVRIEFGGRVVRAQGEQWATAGRGSRAKGVEGV